ncbi:MAG TPA: riboflavin biosynthesis protein RibF, partial [bacterium]|nr:riboflavin biosynthesis protein RibF [bacterium]
VVIGIGKFDGFHIGHQKIVGEILRIADNLKCTPTIFTIRNYPASSFLALWQERIDAFRKHGIALCLWADFMEIQKFPADVFLNTLQSICDIKGIVVGKDFRFGFHRKGDTKFLKTWAKQKEIVVSIVKPVVVNNHIVSSSVIKEMIRNSKFFEARAMLGRWFALKGRHISGRKYGRSIGFPTINLDLLNKNSPLSEGVYVAFVKQSTRIFKSVVFYGSSQTFQTPVSFEIHILDMKIDTSGNEIFTVIPVQKIRDVKKFDTILTLVEQIEKDISKAKKIFDNLDLTI